MPKPSKTLEERFWSKVDKSGDCWIWTAYKRPDGYGQFGFEGTQHKAHRVSWVLANGTIPEGLHVLHRCDVRECVNPEHLFLGTNTDNMRDMIEKGRQSKGLKHRAKCAPPRTATIQSRFRGVCWHKQKKKWHAQATLNGKLVHLGLFTNEEEAADTYRFAVRQIELYEMLWGAR